MLQVLWRIPIYIPGWTPDGIPIYGFGLMLFLAFVLCTWMAGRRGEKEGITREQIQDLAIWVFVGGLLGARLTYLLSETPYTSLEDLLWRLPKIWDGGIVLYGSVLGGLAGYAVAYVLVFRKQGLDTFKLIDVIAPAFAVGLCLGRLGCFLNGCCYGGVVCASCAAVTPVSFPLSAPPRQDLVSLGFQTATGFTLAEPFPVGSKGVKIGIVDPASTAYAVGLRPGDVITQVNGKPIATPNDLAGVLSLGGDWPRGQWTLTVTYHPQGQEEEKVVAYRPWTIGIYPTQIYEVISMFLLFLVLTAYYPLRRRPGQVMAVMMMAYAVHRYLNEILRNDPRPEGFEKYGSVILFGCGLALWLTLQVIPLSPATAASPTPASQPEPLPSTTSPT